MLSVCAISDLHGYLPEIEPCDIVCIAGDIIPLDIQANSRKSKQWFNTIFAEWINNLPCDKVFLVAGNHDFYLERHAISIKLSKDPTKSKCVYLNNEAITYIDNEFNSWNIYGSPLTHKFGNWAFMLEDSGLTKEYQNIPDNIDILICHDTPSYKNLGMLPCSRWNNKPIDAGNKPLAKIIEERQPKYVFCGHLHLCISKYDKIGESNIYNVSLLDNNYKLNQLPTYINMNKDKSVNSEVIKEQND